MLVPQKGRPFLCGIIKKFSPCCARTEPAWGTINIAVTHCDSFAIRNSYLSS